MNPRTPTSRWLYEQLPALYRAKDAEHGYALRDLLDVLGEQGEILVEDARRLYDNQFIETCEEWLVPYLGELVGYKPLHEIEAISQRELVGQWIGLVRSKGTAASIEAVASAATRWPARVVEYFQRLAHPQFVNHPRPNTHGTLNLRDHDRLAELGTAFDSAHYTVDVGRIFRGEGKYNIQNIGVHLWRLQPWRWPRHPAHAVDPSRYLFHPLGWSIPIFNNPATEESRRQLAGLEHLPVPLTRARLRKMIQAGTHRPFRIWINGVELSPAQLRVCDLSDHQGQWAHQAQTRVSVDPQLGRIALPAGTAASNPTVEVEFCEGHPGPLGAGRLFEAPVVADPLAQRISLTTTQLAGALGALPQAQSLLLELSGTEIAQTPLSLTTGQDEQDIRVRARQGHRPVFRLGSPFSITGGPRTRIAVEGLCVAGRGLRISSQDSAESFEVWLRHMTLVPGGDLDAQGEPVDPLAISLEILDPNITVHLERCVIGAIRCHPASSVVATDCIIDANQPQHVAYSAEDGLGPGGPLTMRACTVIGKIHARSFELVSNCILDAALGPSDPWTFPVGAQNTQRGCTRFSYVPPGSKVPRRFRCQPQFAVLEQRRSLEAELARPLSVQEQAIWTERVQDRVRPEYTGRSCASPGYLQLSRWTAPEIRTGADDESEMGAWHSLAQAKRESNLATRLDEFLPNGLQAGIYYET